MYSLRVQHCVCGSEETGMKGKEGESERKKGRVVRLMLVKALCPRGSTVGWSDLCSCQCVSCLSELKLASPLSWPCICAFILEHKIFFSVKFCLSFSFCH